MTYGEREREFTLRSRSLKTGSALPISDNWTFYASYKIRRYERISIGSRRFCWRDRVGQFGPKREVEGVILHQPFFLSQN